ncbi:MAG: hypothetical protein U0V87_09810 [Acidobacteriota bacterium]
MSHLPSHVGARPRRRSPLIAVLDFIGSVTFGLSMMGLLLLYCWIGSAGFAPFSDWFPRQSLEMTELEWFSWWPFKALLTSIAVSLVIVTVRRIKFNLPNLGVWAVHVGVIALMAGTGYYFARKLEGDTAVYRFSAQLSAGGAKSELMLQPGTRAFVYGDGRFYDVRVATIQPQYELLTGADKGRRAYSVQLAVQPYIAGRPGSPFVRQVIAGYPQYTEDVVPGQGRAIKVVGRAILDDALHVELVPYAADRFYLRDSAAVRLRAANDHEWIEYALPRLPRYAEHVADTRSVDAAPGEPLASRALEIRGEASDTPASPPLKGVELRATAFLPHARLEQTWEPGGPLRRPLAQLTLRASGSLTRHALVQSGGVTTLGTATGPLEAQLVWLDSAAARESQRKIEPASVRVRVGNDDRLIPLAELMKGEVSLGATGYSLRGLQFVPHWSVADSGESASVVTIAVTHGTQRYTRAVVSPDGGRSEDLDEAGKRLGKRVDEALDIELLDPVAPALKLVAGEWGVDIGLIGEDGKAEWKSARTGETVEFASRSLSIEVNGLSRESHRVTRPTIIPLRERDTKAGMAHALIRLELSRAGKTQSAWLEYSHYPHPNRYGYKPQRLTFDDGAVLEAVFTRQSRPLPMRLSLAEFQLETYPGGQRERDYISRIRFDDGQGWSEPVDIRSNVPTGHAGWWLFQSTWDPPAPEMGYAGLNFSGVGVANRHGVGAMLGGAIIVAFGLIWAFYVKPTLLHKRREQRRLSIEATVTTPESQPVPTPQVHA